MGFRSTFTFGRTTFTAYGTHLGGGAVMVVVNSFTVLSSSPWMSNLAPCSTSFEQTHPYEPIRSCWYFPTMDRSRTQEAQAHFEVRNGAFTKEVSVRPLWSERPD